MPEAQKKEAEPEKPEEKVIEEKSPVEETARRSGWTPKEEFQGDPEKWVDAKEWIDRAPLYAEMKQLRRKAKTLESTVNDLKKHYERVETNAYQRAVEELKAEKLKALEDGDHRKVVEVDDQLEKMRDQKPVAETKVDPAFTQFVENNDWYARDPDLREYADFIGVKYKTEHSEKTTEEVLQYVERQVRKHPQYRDQFANPNRSKPSSVEGGKPAGSKSSTPRWSDLPEHMQRAGDKFVRQGIMTREQYIADLIKIGEIKV